MPTWVDGCFGLALANDCWKQLYGQLRTVFRRTQIIWKIVVEKIFFTQTYMTFFSDAFQNMLRKINSFNKISTKMLQIFLRDYFFTLSYFSSESAEMYQNKQTVIKIRVNIFYFTLFVEKSFNPEIYWAHRQIFSKSY